jgi:hypothetical protein
MGDLILGVHPKSNGCGDLQRDRRWRTVPARWRHWRFTGALVPSSPRHGGGHGDPYSMQVAGRAAVHSGVFFFPKLDGVAQLLPSSSDGVDGTYGCGTTSSPSS